MCHGGGGGGGTLQGYVAYFGSLSAILHYNACKYGISDLHGDTDLDGE